MIIVTGSLAFDHIMDFSGKFADHLIPDKIHLLSLSFEVDRLEKRPGGTAGNIAYNLALLGEKPVLVAAAGNDFTHYRQRLEAVGVNCDHLVEYKDCSTAQLFIMTDRADNQIAGFYPGAMAKASKLTISDFKRVNLVHVAPDDTRAMANHVNRCQNQGWPYIFDPGQQLIRMEKADLQVAVSLAKAVVGNDYEIALIERKTGLDRCQLAGLTEALIVTRGEKGSDLYYQGRKRSISVVAPKRVVDPTGAGDAYRAGLIKGIIADLGWEAAAKLASTIASFAIERYGTQEHRFTRDDVKLRYNKTFHETINWL